MVEMRNVLSTKLNKKGFTLAELLVVVAILAILVAVSIPIFTGKLNEAKENTDAANVRAAKAVAVAEYLQDDTKQDSMYTRYFDAKEGKMVDDPKTVKPYGKTSAHKEGLVKVNISNDGKTVTTSWVDQNDIELK